MKTVVKVRRRAVDRRRVLGIAAVLVVTTHLAGSARAQCPTGTPIDCTTDVTELMLDDRSTYDRYICGEPYSDTAQLGPEAFYTLTCAGSGNVTVVLEPMTCDLDFFALVGMCDPGTADCLSGSTNFDTVETLSLTCAPGREITVVVEAWDFRPGGACPRSGASYRLFVDPTSPYCAAGAVDGGPVARDGGPAAADGGPVAIDGGPVTIDGGPVTIDGGPVTIDGGPVAEEDAGGGDADGGATDVDASAEADAGLVEADSSIEELDGAASSDDGGASLDASGPRIDGGSGGARDAGTAGAGSSGCGCRVPSSQSRPFHAQQAGLLALLSVLVWRRRQR
jgi:hypothetical protein